MSTTGEIISTGCNDVPKYEGGYYYDSDGRDDGRCKSIFKNICRNHETKKNMTEDIKKILNKRLDSPGNVDVIIDEIQNIERFKAIIGYCRAVHAEMDAIIKVARQGNISLQRTSLYCTTFPCHSCARHIVAAGIKKVFYIEPYEKSLAREFHHDSINFEPSENGESSKKVVFMPFEGVAPKQYSNFFKSGVRKVDGSRIKMDIKDQKPSVASFLDSYLDYEQKVVKYLKELEIN